MTVFLKMCDGSKFTIGDAILFARSRELNPVAHRKMSIQIAVNRNAAQSDGIVDER